MLLCCVLGDLWCKKSRDEDSKRVSYASLVTEPQGVEGAHRKHLSIWCPGQRGDWVFVRWRGVELTAKTVPYLLRKDNVWQVNKTAESCWLLVWMREVKMTSFWFKTSCHLYPPIFFSSLMKKNRCRNTLGFPLHSLCVHASRFSYQKCPPYICSLLLLTVWGHWLNSSPPSGQDHHEPSTREKWEGRRKDYLISSM